MSISTDRTRQRGMNVASPPAEPCRYCGEPLIRETCKEDVYFTDPEGAVICSDASTVWYVAHEPLADSQIEQAQVLR